MNCFGSYVSSPLEYETVVFCIAVTNDRLQCRCTSGSADRCSGNCVCRCRINGRDVNALEDAEVLEVEA